MMRPAICPYCGEKSYTSNPQLMSKCSLCGEWYAEARTGAGETLVILDRNIPGVVDLAVKLTAKWQAAGENRSAVVDRRRAPERYTGQERRLFAAHPV